MKAIHMQNFINLKELLQSYCQSMNSFVNLQIGYDDQIYILLSANIPKRINGMFVDTEANTFYYAIRLTVDWNEGEIVHQEMLELGHHRMNFHFIQPIKDKILLLGSRCVYRESTGPEQNAVIVDSFGNVFREFCLGDGIEDCIVMESGDIITSYFDEGVFGNFGWEQPIGSCGLIVWNSKGDIKWKASRPIYDCYALNVDENNNLWYYYYDEFALVKTDMQKEVVYHPDISGATGFLITADSRTIMFDGGYNKHCDFQVATLGYGEIQNYENVNILYNEKPLLNKRFWFRGSKAVFMDSDNRLYSKQFISL